MRSVWHYYFSSTEGIIFVVDSSRADRMTEVKEELHKCLTHERGVEIPILVYANKQDLEGAMEGSAIIDALDIYDNNTVADPKKLVHVQTCTCKGAVGGNDGLKEGLEWLCKRIVELDLAKNAH